MPGKGGHEEFQEHWEREAAREQAEFNAMPLAALLDRVRTRKWGSYYTLWYAIAQKASPMDAGWILFDLLNSSAPYLDRYHCAAALIAIVGDATRTWEPAMLSAEKTYPVRENIKTMQALLEGLVGARGKSV